jgi:pimeloyl-ACP methyl ester carboxylesterase
MRMNDSIEGYAGEQVGIVMIHGAGLNGAVWERIASRLSVPCLCAEYPYLGGTMDARKSLGLRDYSAQVVEQIKAWHVRRVVLVAHSLGGVVALQAADALQDRVIGFVGVGAVIPAGGGSFLSALPWPQRTVMRAIMRLLGTKPPESAIRQGLCSDLSAEQAAAVAEGFVPEVVRVYLDRVEAGIPDVARLYVKLDNDRELSPALQDTMAANLVASGVARIASGHLPMISKPAELQLVLDGFVAQFPER